MSNIREEMEDNLPFWFELIRKAGKYCRKNRLAQTGVRDEGFGHIYGDIVYLAKIGEDDIRIEFNIANFMDGQAEECDLKVSFQTDLFEVDFIIEADNVQWCSVDHFLSEVVDDKDFNVKYFDFPFVSSRSANMLIMTNRFDYSTWNYAPNVSDGNVEDFLIKMKLTS